MYFHNTVGILQSADQLLHICIFIVCQPLQLTVALCLSLIACHAAGRLCCILLWRVLTRCSSSLASSSTSVTFSYGQRQKKVWVFVLPMNNVWLLSLSQLWRRGRQHTQTHTYTHTHFHMLVKTLNWHNTS